MTHSPAGRIDEEIDMVNLVMQLIHFLHSCRSVSTPTSVVLPPELLARIFHFYALQAPPWSDGVQKLGWIAVTHVCQHWRQVALGDSSLWANITGISPNSKWISEMLVRARNAPLVVDFAVTPVPGILSKFSPHIFRIRELRLRDVSLLHSQGLREICALGAPALEHFEIGVSGPSPVTFHELCGTTLFRGRAPKLRTLSLSKVYIPWSLIPRGQLTQLKITLVRGIPTPSTPSPCDSNHLLDLLINSPDLEVLVLEFCIPAMLFQAPDGQAIHLPRLSRLRLGGSTSHVANILKILQLPPSTTLHLRCISENPFTHNVNVILPLVSAHFHNPAPVEFRSLRITINRFNSPIYVAASVARPESTIPGLHALEYDTDGNAELTMSFHGAPLSRYSTQENIIKDVFNMLPISNLESLSISVPPFVPFVYWYDLCQRCEKVTTIRASGHGTSDLLRSLAPLKPTKPTSGSKEKKGRYINRDTLAQEANTTGTHAPITPFQKLTSLLLENLDFGYGLYDEFAYVLRRRRANNMSLNILGVDHCVITPDHTKGLKRYVQELRWDGDEGLDEPIPFDEWPCHVSHLFGGWGY